jgi:hypothetical protein
MGTVMVCEGVRERHNGRESEEEEDHEDMIPQFEDDVCYKDSTMLCGSTVAPPNATEHNTTQHNPNTRGYGTKLPSIYISYTYGALVHATAVVDLAHVDQLLPPRARNLVRQLLLGQRFPGGLDDVHLVARAGCLGGEVLQAAGAGELEDQVLGAETEACELLVGGISRL